MNLGILATSHKNRKHFFDIFLLVAVSSVVLFPSLGQNRHWYSREIRHAEIIREMVESGDYLVPRLLGKIYYDKPPVMHAAAAILTRIAGELSMTMARMPSALAGMLGILATYVIGLLLFDRRSAFIGALVLLCIPGYSLMARQARPDMLLCFSVLFSCLCLGLGMRAQSCVPRMFSFALAGLFAGIGIVTKGPYGVLFPAFFVIFAPFRRQDLTRPGFGWLGFGLGIITIMAIWAVPAYLRDSGEYLRKVIFQPDLDISKGGNSERRYFYYVWTGILYTLPISLFLPLSIIDLRRRGYSAPLAVAGAIFVVISFVPQKRPHYLLPLYPFLALGITSSIVYHYKTSQIVRKAAWILIPLSIAATPFYFAVVQPIAHPSEELDMLFAKETIRLTEPNALVYCIRNEEALAWVGRQHDRIRKIPDGSSASEILSKAEAGSYLLTDDKNYSALLKTTGNLPYELILQRSDGREKRLLLRLKAQ